MSNDRVKANPGACPRRAGTAALEPCWTAPVVAETASTTHPWRTHCPPRGEVLKDGPRDTGNAPADSPPASSSHPGDGASLHVHTSRSAGGRPGGAPQFSELPDAGTGAGADSGSIDAANFVPAEILDGGEIIILAIKPSLWYVVIKSSRWIVGMVLTLLALHWLDPRALPISEAVITQAAVALTGARVGLALMQWVSRLYILTNRRILRLTGIFNVDLFECQLTKIQSTFLTMAWYERILKIGTISFATAANGIGCSWTHVNNPLELHERVRSAIHRAQRPNNGI